MKGTLVFIGAWDYGNFGDDLYRYIFKDHFFDYDCIFCNSDISEGLLKKIRQRNNIKAFVFGGGGIVYDNKKKHFEYMETYYKLAKELKVPFGFTSVGIQLVNRNNKDFFATEGARWEQILRESSFNFFRHEQDVDYLNSKGIDAEYYPDLGYCIPDFIQGIEARDNTLVTWNSLLVKELEKNDEKMAGDQLIFLSKDDENMYRESSCEPSKTHKFKYSELGFEETCRLISTFKTIQTGRFHGMVVGKAYGLNVIAPKHALPVKFEKEEEYPNMDAAARNLFFISYL